MTCTDPGQIVFVSVIGIDLERSQTPCFGQYLTQLPYLVIFGAEIANLQCDKAVGYCIEGPEIGRDVTVYVISPNFIGRLEPDMELAMSLTFDSIDPLGRWKLIHPTPPFAVSL